MDKAKRPQDALSLTGVITLSGLLSILLGPRLIPQLCIAATFLFLITKRRYIWVDILLRTLRRDLTAAWRFIIVNLRIWTWERNNQTVAKVFREVCHRHSEKVALRFQDEAWTYRQLDQYCNRIGNYFKSLNYAKGDTVALFMENRMEYVGIWLGLSRIGVVTALINSNLREGPLIHSISIAGSKAVIYSAGLKQAVKDVESELGKTSLIELTSPDEEGLISPSVENLREAVSTASDGSLDDDMNKLGPRDKLIYIYTSGTTGLPKAAVITNMRYMFTAFGVHAMLGIRDDDVLYNPLPLYHTSGGTIGIGQALLTGNTVAIRQKFSASSFWEDCIKYDASVACYIGEICRYLLAVPDKPVDKRHRVRLMYGNGLRPQIWQQFVERFQIEQIGEFYGATEGNSNLVNIDSHEGAVGFIPRIAKALYPVTLIKINQTTEDPVRNSRGFCIECRPGEPGMFVGKINSTKPINAFTGYADKAASDKKILKNVFSKGDEYFNSGDILVMDEYGYFYFKDRTGDTFRWRGENVATSEVEAVVSNIVGLKDAIVYGVEVPHVEGKAGMTAILDVEGCIDINQLDDGLKKKLPIYARPLFVRILREVPLTGTYKLMKKDLQAEGFNIEVMKDTVYYHDHRERRFVKLTLKLYQELVNGQARL